MDGTAASAVLAPVGRILRLVDAEVIRLTQFARRKSADLRLIGVERMAADIYADQIPLLLQHLRLRPFVGHRQRRLHLRGPIAGRSEERVLARQLVSLDALRVLNGGVERGDMLSAVSFQFIQCANARQAFERDRKSTRLNSSHVAISYAVFCLKKKKRPQSTAPGS